MSVRRLAEPSIQPPSFAFSPENVEWVERTIQKYPEGRQQSAVIPLLMKAQDQEGWVSKSAIEHVAERLGMAYIRVLEVATFYTQFQLKPMGSRAHVQVCGTTPCALRGAEALMDVCRRKIHHEQFHTNPAGTLSWEEVECLGACVNAPMIMVFKDTYEDLTPERLGEIIDAFERGEGASVPVGPQNGRFVSTPISGQKVLLDEEAIIAAARASSGPAPEEPPANIDQTMVPPSTAGRPETATPDTNAALKSPSPVKVDIAEERAVSAEPPPHDEKAADMAEPHVEGEGKERARHQEPKGDPAFKAPELHKGEPQGPNEKREPGSVRFPEGAPMPEGKGAADGSSQRGEPKPDGVSGKSGAE
ncbi:MAG TPA: NADH-quinone oxidoreductase subunit NuoE [Mesorhizobium sp.]|jgi:NADH-quinone oxidoreductase subunit E|nr:NADH-quinone oxidoreductase subunit NuoE [Mesorhizobium sp.]